MEGPRGILYPLTGQEQDDCMHVLLYISIFYDFLDIHTFNSKIIPAVWYNMSCPCTRTGAWVDPAPACQLRGRPDGVSPDQSAAGQVEDRYVFGEAANSVAISVFR
jgi:hypothetical protein